MKILCIETSCAMANATTSGVALMDGSALKPKGQRFTPQGMTQGEFLVPAISSLLEAHHLTLADLNALVLSLGPGSFTGIRIGLSTAQGLAFTHQTPILGYSSLKALSVNGLEWIQKQPPQNKRGVLCPMFDARKQEIYAGLYQAVSNKQGLLMPEVLLADSIMEPIAWCQKLKEALPPQTPLLFMGDGAKAYEHVIQEILADYFAIEFFKSGPLAHPRPQNLGLLAWPDLIEKKIPAAADLKPIYLRPLDREFKKKSD